ncbi:MAG: heme-binding domain-containing protein [Bryobacteraceae bacterium]|nr:heme-binding domain-containing protein [Bryobacteraceae bacterium]
MRGFVRLAGVSAAALLLGIQFIPAPPLDNPPVDPAKTVEAQLEIPAPMKKLLDRSCRDCHSNETHWPWYSRFAPGSWLVARDVRKARDIMNFSNWTEQAGRKLELAAGMLAASCSDVTVGRMPKPNYAFLHSEARLSAEDKKDFCAWSAAEGERLFQIRRRKMATP